MRIRLWGLAAVLISASFAFADEPIDSDQLQRLYDTTLKQLETAQKRKNELAAENEALKAKLAEAEKQLAAAQSDLSKLQQEAAQWAEKTYVYRSIQAAWQEYLRTHPRLKAEWDAYLNTGLLDTMPDLPDWAGRQWPVSDNR